MGALGSESDSVKAPEENKAFSIAKNAEEEKREECHEVALALFLINDPISVCKGLNKAVSEINKIIW
jgi:hypothetical protein